MSPPVSKGAEKDNFTEDDYVAQRPSRVKTYEVDNERCGSFTLNVFLLVLLSAVPALAFGVLFTYIGYGATVHKFLVQQIEYARLVGYGGILIFVLICGRLLLARYWLYYASKHVRDPAAVTYVSGVLLAKLPGYAVVAVSYVVPIILWDIASHMFP